MSAELELDWLNRLCDNCAERDAAIAQLRDYLVRGLSKSLCHRYNGNVDAEDVVQVALIKILASLNTFNGRSRFTTWAMAIATRVGISELRRKCYQDVSLNNLIANEDFKFDIPARDEPSHEQAARLDLIGQLHRLIEQDLSEKQKTAILGTLNDLPIEVIAQRLGSNRNAIYKLVHDARMKLRIGLEQQGYRIEDLQTLFA